MRKAGMILAGVVLLLLGIGLSAASAQQKSKVITWTIQSSYPGQHWTEGGGGMAPLLGDFLKEATKGRLELKIIPPGGLVKANDVLAAVSKGTLDAAGLHYAGFYTGTMPEAEIEVGLPYAWENQQEALDAYINYGLLEKFRKIYAERNIFWTPAFLGCIYSIQTTFPISSPADLKGKKIRALGPYASWVKAFGGSPTVIPATELYMALKLGTIDGTISSGSFLTTAKLEEVIKYAVISPNFNNIVANFIVNMNSLKALPEEIRGLVESAMLPIVSTGSMGIGVGEQKAYRRAATKYGLKLVSFKGKEKEKAMSVGFGLWDQIATKSGRCGELVSIVKKQMQDYGKLK